MIIVLGFDGLGLELIEEFKLKAIKQKAYTETDLSDFKTHPFTPIIWASMLTGRKIDEMEKIYMNYQIDTSGFIFSVAKKLLPVNIRKRLRVMYSRIVWKWRGIEKNPMQALQGWLKDNNVKTIFDEFKENNISYWHNNIPGYNGVPHHNENMEIVKKALSGHKEYYDKYRKLVWQQHIERKRTFFNALSKGYEVYFFYTNLVDALGHLFYHSAMERMKMAFEVEKIVSHVRDKFPDARIYVVSDHGMEIRNGIPDHSDKGFFSSNTGELIRKPMELYDLLHRVME